MSASTGTAAAASPPAPAASAAAAAAPAPAAPAELFIPAHTRGWRGEQRARYEKYVATRELPEVSTIIGEATTTSAEAIAQARQAATPAPLPSLSPAAVSDALAATASSLCAVPSAGSLAARGRLIQLGDQALVDFGRGQAWLNLDGLPQRSLRLAKQTAKVGNLAGQPYGNVWELDNKTQLLTRTNRKRGLGTALLDAAQLPDSTRNNSQLYDTNAAQALSQSEIEALKKQTDSGVSGAELVDLIVSNSATFASKTEYSQEKYLKKKRAKHLSEVVVLPVSLARVAEAFWQKDPKKIRGLRPDMISLLLSTANARAGASSLVVENCSGLVLGSLLYRTQGLSYVVHAFEHNQKRTEGVKRFNFSTDVQSALVHVPLDKLLNKQVAVAAQTGAAAPATPAAAAAAAASGADATAMDTSDAAAAAPAQPLQDLTGEQVLSQQVDTLILASRYEPWHLLSTLWPFLRPGGRFVVYDECIEPLSAAHAKLQADMAVNVVLSEQFFRHHQVLPNRTHPFVNMSASGGYLLSGTKMRPPQK